MDTPAIASQPVPRAQQTEPLAIVSFVLSLCGWFGFAFVAWVPAVICGHIARSKMRATENLQADGFAVAGLIISYVGLVLIAIAAILFIGIFAVRLGHTAPQMQFHLPSQP